MKGVGRGGGEGGKYQDEGECQSHGEVMSSCGGVLFLVLTDMTVVSH